MASTPVGIALLQRDYRWPRCDDSNNFPRSGLDFPPLSLRALYPSPREALRRVFLLIHVKNPDVTKHRLVYNPFLSLPYARTPCQGNAFHFDLDSLLPSDRVITTTS